MKLSLPYGPSEYERFCSYENLLLAFKKARKGKTQRPYVVEFEKNLKENLLQLRADLLFHSYRPQPLRTFIIRDPKTRKISKSAFRDRIVHHALCNIIEPKFEKRFIHDSYANRKGKGTLKAIQRFDIFARKASRNHTRKAYVLKADIRQYFDNVDHNILLSILKKQVNDAGVLWLIATILQNHKSSAAGKGMPLGNLTSQFFANVYLNELDQYVKHKLHVSYYIRYVDDFVLLKVSKQSLEQSSTQIESFLGFHLRLSLHPTKSKIFPLSAGTDFLGIRIFPHHKLLRKKNLRKFQRKLHAYYDTYSTDPSAYDILYNFLEGWCAYARNANTYRYRRGLLQEFEERCTGMASKEVCRYLGCHGTNGYA